MVCARIVRVSGMFWRVFWWRGEVDRALAAVLDFALENVRPRRRCSSGIYKDVGVGASFNGGGRHLGGGGICLPLLIAIQDAESWSVLQTEAAADTLNACESDVTAENRYGVLGGAGFMEWIRVEKREKGELDLLWRLKK